MHVFMVSTEVLKEGAAFPGTGVTGGCDSPCGAGKSLVFCESSKCSELQSHFTTAATTLLKKIDLIPGFIFFTYKKLQNFIGGIYFYKKYFLLTAVLIVAIVLNPRPVSLFNF